MQECSGNITAHAEEEQVEAALEYGAAPSLFTKILPEALPTEAAVPKNWCARSAQGMLFWKEVWSWTKACSKLSRLFFPLDFASLLSRKRWKTLLSRAVWGRKATCTNLYRITATGAQTHGKLLHWHRHTWCCVWNQRRTLSKKRDELSKLTENSWTCCCLVTEMRSSAQGVLSFTMI